MTHIGVFGLGYVGAVSLAILADNGHKVVGVDTNPAKVELINAGRSPVVEAGLDELIRRSVEAGRVRATTDAEHAVRSCDVSMICVGTPSHSNGSLDLSQIEKVSYEVGSALARADGFHVVVVRSTMLPGSMASVVVPALETASGLRAGRHFGVCYNPEFLREGSSVRDFYDPPFTLIGTDDPKTAGRVSALYSMLEADVIVTPPGVAEMVKYVSNAFHALKVTFANEIGSICKLLGVDSHQVMDIFRRDKKLNVSDAYLRPGFAFGGSCLPKDLRALTHQARTLDLPVPVLESIIPSNKLQIDRALQLIQRFGRRTRVGVLGLSFKAGTDDLRESPLVEVTERLIGKGHPVKVYDRNVSLAALQGANRAYIEREIPHIASLMCDSIDDLLTASDVVVVGTRDPEFEHIVGAPGDLKVVDLVRLSNLTGGSQDGYEGMCW